MYPEVAPEFAAEVVDAQDSREDVLRKAREFIALGSPLFWVVDPGLQRVDVLHASEDVQVLRPGDEITGETQIPGFRCHVAQFFE